jgi:putative transposase
VGRNQGNSRTGKRSKTLVTDSCGDAIDMPRDLDATFESVIVKKRQRRLTDVDEVVLSLYAKSLTTGEISAHFASVYGASASKDTVSRITDMVIEEMLAWSNRPLERVYAAVFIDAIIVKIRDGQVGNRPVYAAIGVDLDGHKNILGMWAGDGGGASAKFWMSVLTELGNRGVADVFFCRVQRVEGAARLGERGMAVGHGPGVHHPPDPRHVPLRLTQALGRAVQGPAPDLHRSQCRRCRDGLGHLG